MVGVFILIYFVLERNSSELIPGKGGGGVIGGL